MTGPMDDLCRRGVHAMTPENTGTQASTGRRYCRACRAAYKRGKRREENPPTTMCRKGLHDLSDPGNVYVSPRGKRACRPCKRAACQRRKAKAATPEPERSTEPILNPASVPPGGIQAYGVSGEAAARYRLALQVRASRP